MLPYLNPIYMSSVKQVGSREDKASLFIQGKALLLEATVHLGGYSFYYYSIIIIITEIFLNISAARSQHPAQTFTSTHGNLIKSVLNFEFCHWMARKGQKKRRQRQKVRHR